MYAMCVVNNHPLHTSSQRFDFAHQNSLTSQCAFELLAKHIPKLIVSEIREENTRTTKIRLEYNLA